MTDFLADTDLPMLAEDPAAFAPFASGPLLNMDTGSQLGTPNDLENLVEQLNVEQELPMEMPMPSQLAEDRASFGHEQLLSAVAGQPMRLPIQIRLDETLYIYYKFVYPILITQSHMRRFWALQPQNHSALSSRMSCSVKPLQT